eukprot:GABV01006927.1.p1 GENE.GABV01006927.1~~GABV01006927.1.p1  ORF type:complete len:142 (-),score=21.60 GABV01006927.1:3-428(-)
MGASFGRIIDFEGRKLKVLSHISPDQGALSQVILLKDTASNEPFALKRSVVSKSDPDAIAACRRELEVASRSPLTSISRGSKAPASGRQTTTKSNFCFSPNIVGVAPSLTVLPANAILPHNANCSSNFSALPRPLDTPLDA